MRVKKFSLIPLYFILLCSRAFAFPVESSNWGFRVDLPEGYVFSSGDGRDTFSFENANGAKFDIAIYASERTAGVQGRTYASVDALARDVHARLKNSGDIDFFEYRGKKASLLTLEFQLSGSLMTGWALCIELDTPGSRQAGSAAQSERSPSTTKPLLLTMAYGPAERNGLASFHLSALDSLAPEESDRLAPGPISEFAYPRDTRIRTPIYGLGIHAWIFEEDAEAAQTLIDREYFILRHYENAPNWKQAWTRFYQIIYRDSFERLVDIAFQVERKLNISSTENRNPDNREFANQVLRWVQTFEYERDLEGSDFINLISAAAEGRGDCDNRAMLWAVILIQADIPAAMMVSRNYGHAMGLVDLPGAGARFDLEGQKFLVAETTADVPIGLIGETVSEIEHWLGIPFDIHTSW